MLDCCKMHPVLGAGESDMACARNLQVKDVDLEEVTGHQLLKPVQVPSSVPLTRFH